MGPPCSVLTTASYTLLFSHRKMPDIAAAELDQIDDLLKGPTMLEETLERLYTEAIEKGLAKGQSIGMSQGLSQGLSLIFSQGASQLLGRLLEQRFGPLPEWASQRLQSASSPQLEHWADQLFTASTLETLLATQDSAG